jgi:hypothetical protein
MSEFDDVIRAAREGLAPSVADEARVWKRVATRAGIVGGAVALVTKSAAGAAAGTTAGSGGVLAGQSLGAVAKVLFGSMALTLAGAGTVVAVIAPSPKASESPSATRPASRPAATPRLGARRFDSPHAATPSASAAASAGAVAPSASGVQSAFGQAPPPRIQPARREGAALAGAVADAPASAGPAREGVSRELGLLIEVRRASDGGEHGHAQRLLDRLDEEHPGGALLEERAALRAVASCAADGSGRAERAREFLRRYPGSVYAAKVQRVCDGQAASEPGTPRATKSFTDLDGSGH